MNLQRIVEQLGYRETEAKVYIALTECGEATVTNLARAVSAPRTSVQSILESLHRKGVVDFYTMKRRKMWCSKSPRTLLKRHEELHTELRNALPELERLRKGSSNPLRAIHIHNAVAIKRVLEEMITPGQKITILGPARGLEMALGVAHVDAFLKKCRTHAANVHIVDVATAGSETFVGQEGTAVLISSVRKTLIITAEENGPAAILIDGTAVSNLAALLAQTHRTH